MNYDSVDIHSIRAEYESKVRRLAENAAQMRSTGIDIEVIARTVYSARRALAAHYKELTPEPLRTHLYERTFALYGDRVGPTLEFLRQRGRSWSQIIESAVRPGSI